MKLVLATLALASPAAAQTLTVHDLTQGDTARFVLGDGVPGSAAVLLAGFGGLGAGPCFDADACLGFLPPPLLVLDLALIEPDGSVEFALPLAASLPLVTVAFQVLEGTGLGPVDFRTSNAVLATVAPVSDLGVDFESGALPAAWTTLQPGLGEVAVEAGELVLTPSAGGLPDMWFDDGEGLAFVRPIHGDFELTTEVRVHAPGDPSSPPATGYRLAGLLIRDPSASAPGTHEWCHIATGSGNAGEPAGVEWKETHGSSSQWAIVPTASTHQELRLVRAGDAITAWHRAPGAPTWTLLATYDFPDLPLTVEAGAMAYSFSSPPEVVARFAALAFD